MIHSGDCLEVLKTIDSESVDSLVTDPPAGISFMGKEWDDDKGGRKQWIAWMTEVMVECLRVMKPGAHGLVWALPRTSHWTATALEDAGFEVRDVVTHLFGTGFPKSMNLEKAGAGSEWSGWGTALKPASEHWILVRKPCSEKTVAANALKWGVGGINIDASRVEGTAETPFGRQTGKGISDNGNGATHGKMERTELVPNSQGRFPANLVLDEEAAAALDEQSGVSKSPSSYVRGTNSGSKTCYSASAPIGELAGKLSQNFGDSGGASRFFYVAKASKSDKGAYNTHPTVKSTALMKYLIKLVTPHGGVVLDPFMGSGSTGVAALSLGLSFIGIEKIPEYHATAIKRMGLFA